MEDDQNHTESRSKKIEVVLKDLDVLLRGEFGKNVIVDSFETSNLVPSGENYGSTMLKVDAEVKRNGENSESEKFSFVAKMVPPTEFQKIMFDSPFTFRKEIYMFTHIVPAYKDIEREYGIPEDEIVDLFPKIYGARLSLRNTEDDFDNDAVILMENLKLENYVCGNRRIGLDLVHAEAVIVALAHFHALGVAVKIKKPDLFEEIKQRAESMKFREEEMGHVQAGIMNDVNKIPALIPHIPKIDKIVNSSALDSWLKPPQEPWATIVHTDFWVNNVMFTDDENGKPLGVKLIDFQNYLYQNPARDLVFCIFSSCMKEVRDINADHLIDLYYKKFTSHLARLECDLSEFTRDSFNEQVVDAAAIEYTHCVLMAKVILADVQADPTAADFEQIFDKESSDECRALMADVSLKFIEKNWL